MRPGGSRGSVERSLGEGGWIEPGKEKEEKEKEKEEEVTENYMEKDKAKEEETEKGD